MKTKSRKCSTGHGTGSTPHMELREILDRDEYRTARKQGRRERKRPGTIRHHGKSVRDERGRSVPVSRRDYYAKPAPEGDLRSFWQDRLMRSFGGLLGRKGDAAKDRATRLAEGRLA